MMRSLFSAVSGLRTHQTRMDVIGNNIANVNTPGYKSSRMTFQEVFSQTLRGASSPSGDSKTERGGTNPMQIGLGVDVASINSLQTPGSLQPTSRPTDLGIEGNGFFIVRDGGSIAYTRVGNFSIDGQGILVDYEGRKVLGVADDFLPASIDANELTSLQIEIGSTMQAQATGNVQWIKNLDAEAEIGTKKETAVTVYDSQGCTHTVQFTFEKINDNGWKWTGADKSGTLQFDEEGKFTSLDGDNEFTLTTGSAGDITVTMDFTRLTQVAGPTTLETGIVDGWPAGTLESYSFDSSGVISGFYSNGRNEILGQIALANFDNPQGLLQLGKGLFMESNNSGKAAVGAAGTSGRGSIAPSALEMSNVDLAEEFTQMIITQRGFQANSRVISVSDELLQELVNLKR